MLGQRRISKDHLDLLCVGEGEWTENAARWLITLRVD